VIVVEWGEGKVEELTDDRLSVVIHRAVGDTTDEVRLVTVTGLGERWASVELGVLCA
jgi:tRNA threonylcarbamoyladenosine biosynthesis protein TsaE